MGEQVPVMILGRNPNICNNLGADLKVLGFNPLPGKYPDIDREDITRKSPCIILLELTVCDHDALSVCQILLSEDILPPETTLVALVSENTMGQIPLDYKFTDIIKFPYGITELGFRIRRVMHHRHQEPDENTIHIGNLSILLSRHEVEVDGQPVVLNHIEYELLKFLATHPNRVFTREVLLTNVWGYNIPGDNHIVDVNICRVRAKIGDISSTYIKTVRRSGYILRSQG